LKYTSPALLGGGVRRGLDEYSCCYMNEETTSGGRFDEVNRNKKKAQPDEVFRHLMKFLMSPLSKPATL
jgi:hypothetical protein